MADMATNEVDSTIGIGKPSRLIGSGAAFTQAHLLCMIDHISDLVSPTGQHE